MKRALCSLVMMAAMPAWAQQAQQPTVIQNYLQQETGYAPPQTYAAPPQAYAPPPSLQPQPNVVQRYLQQEAGYAPVPVQPQPVPQLNYPYNTAYDPAPQAYVPPASSSESNEINGGVRGMNF